MLLSGKSLSGVSAVIFDEFHERSLTVDLGLALVKHLQETARPDLKIVVMSATLDTGPLTEFLNGATVVHADGRIFPITITYTPDASKHEPWDAAAAAALTLIKNGARGDLLIFMPGVYEIRRTVAALSEQRFGEQVRLCMLYGDAPERAQRDVMTPDARRTIIVATNIAETSITIQGVRHVIDSGLARINRFDAGRGFNTLYVERISRDSANQRAGRAGREDAGICIRLWSIADHQTRPQRTQPEVARIDLAETILQLKVLGYPDPAGFSWFEPPPQSAIETGAELLGLVGAIDAASDCVTPMGKTMAELPMHPRLARLLIEAARLGIVKQGARAAALLTERPILTGEPQLPDTIASQCGGSDFALLGAVIDMAEECRYDPARVAKLTVNCSAVRQVLRTEAYFVQACRKRGMHTRTLSHDPALLSRALCTAYPDRIARRRDLGTLQCDLRDGRRGELARESCARSAKLFIATTVRELVSRKHSSPRILLSMACSIELPWLEELFPGEFRTETLLEWNPVREGIEGRIRRTFCGVCIDEKNDPHPDPEAAAGLLAATIHARKFPLAGWNAAVEDFIGRVQWLRARFPGNSLPAFSQQDRALIVTELCRGETRYAGVKDKPVLQLVKKFLSHEQLRFVEAMAPDLLYTPAGRKLRVLYPPGRPPYIRAKIQELFDMKSTPRIAGGAAPIVIEILAPNMRPVQVTEDLEGFWKQHYPQLKKQLSRRYPKHEWR
jgi:ATP-dependent helicase HrpB